MEKQKDIPDPASNWVDSLVGGFCEGKKFFGQLIAVLPSEYVIVQNHGAQMILRRRYVSQIWQVPIDQRGEDNGL